MSFQKIISDIEKEKFAPVYYLFGEEEFYKEAIADKLDAHVLTEDQKSFNKITVNARESGLGPLIDYARRYPVMAERQYVVCKDAENIKEFDPLIPYLENPAKTTVLLLVASGKKLDKRTKAYKALKKAGVVFESKRPYEDKMPTWISDYVDLKGRKIEPDAAHLVAEYLGTDLKKSANELDKLCILLDEDQTIGKEDIERSIGISREFNVFELQKAIGQGKNTKALLIADQMSKNMQSNAMPLVTGSFFNYFSRIYKLKSLETKSSGDLAKKLGVHPYFIPEYTRAARFLSSEILEKIFVLLNEYDLKSKGLERRNNPSSELFRELVMRMLALLTARSAKN